MTHEERATLIVSDWATQHHATAAGGNGAFKLLIDKISRGMAEASNGELERRREIEIQCEEFARTISDRRRIADEAWFRRFFASKAGWSQRTFGPGIRTRGITEHIRRELIEIEAAPHDLTEWVDVVLLAMDGFARAWMDRVADALRPPPIRHGWHDLAAGAFIRHLCEKQAKNEGRNWPAPGPEDQPTEHVRD